VCENVPMGHDNQPLWRRAATHTLHTSLVLKAALEEALTADTGLLLADNEALLNLRDHPMRMSDIATRLILSRGGTTKVIDRLEDLGYVSRTQDPDDRRATLVEITEAGRDVQARAQELIDDQLLAMWSPHLSDEEATTLIDVMDRVINEWNH
jgi:MarR family transcriptional regulator, multiple antibiotic resistance protein MarR